RGLLMLDKTNEEFFQFNTPLSGLDTLQAQAQEHMFFVSAIPSVKFAGLSPTGLNASSEGEIRVFYDTIAALATRLLKKPLKKVLDIIQLSEFGDIDPDITFEFEP
ncbi:anti-CBASS protein Acb1 family protein, partial [Escherichia coli]